MTLTNTSYWHSSVKRNNFVDIALSEYCNVFWKIKESDTVLSASRLLQVSVFGFGADQYGNWHHYWEENHLAGAFRHTGVHDGDYEYNVTLLLADKHKIRMFRGRWYQARMCAAGITAKRTSAAFQCLFFPRLTLEECYCHDFQRRSHMNSSGLSGFFT